MIRTDFASDAEFLAYTEAMCLEWQREAEEKAAAEARAAAVARAEQQRRELPKDWHRTFRGVPAQVDRALETLCGPGVFRDTCVRRIEGIACSTELTSHGWARDPMGADFQLPLPVLLAHKWDRPIGLVTELVRGPESITFKARVANNIEGLEDIWAGIMTGMRIGISTDASHYGDVRFDARKGYRVAHRWRICELSVCEDMGADPQARILRVTEKVGQRELVHRDARQRSQQHVVRI